METPHAARRIEPWPCICWGLEADPSKVPFTGPKALEVSVETVSIALAVHFAAAQSFCNGILDGEWKYENVTVATFAITVEMTNGHWAQF